MSVAGRTLWTLTLFALVGGLAWLTYQRLQEATAPEEKKKARLAAPVEVAAVRHGPIELRRTFSGTLEARSEFVVAPKVSGRVERLNVDIGDAVERGRVVAELDNDEYVQAVTQAQADLAVARANLSEAGSALRIAARELERVQELQGRGVSSESQLDGARLTQLAKQAQLEVARAQVTRAEAALEATRIRLGYTRVSAGWSGGDARRIVAERYVDEGETVAPNTPLLLIVELDPITGVFHVTEKDYARLRTGQTVELTTDAYPGERFGGEVARIAPVFRQATRQARVEVRIDNAGMRLKPGMFVRASAVLERVEDAVVVPEAALTRRDGRDGVFLLMDDGSRVQWREVTPGIRQGEAVQLRDADITGRVVTLGQQLVDDGAAVRVADQRDTTP